MNPSQLAGVNEDAIVKEYALSKEGLAPYMGFILGYLNKRPDVQANPEGAKLMMTSECVLVTFSDVRVTEQRNL